MKDETILLTGESDAGVESEDPRSVAACLHLIVHNKNNGNSKFTTRRR